MDSNTIAQMNDATYSTVIFPAGSHPRLRSQRYLDADYGELVDYNEVDELAVRSPEINRKLRE